MNWTIIGLIWFREMRDLLRDRRTLFMILVVPIILYPIMGLIGLWLGMALVERQNVIGVHGLEHLPELRPTSAGLSPIPSTTWLAALAPGDPAAVGWGFDRIAGAAALHYAGRLQQVYPPLVIGERFPSVWCESERQARVLRVEPLESPDREPLDTGKVDVILVIPEGFIPQLESGGRPVLQVLTRANDERSRLADKRLKVILDRWKQVLRTVRFLRRQLPVDFDEPIRLIDPAKEDQPPLKEEIDEILSLLARFFPFMLVMWSMAGALYPAIDLCAGEKERGTMETLLISPATRAEIVAGKFLSIWMFSGTSSLWNLGWMGGGAWFAGLLLPSPIVRTTGLFWCGVLLLPLAALFSAVCLALGAFARTTKEGQYYLMPLFLVTTPLIFITLSPAVELSFLYSLVPVTGAALLLQRLMTAATLDQVPWLYFFPVFLSLAFYVWLALRWAVAQFNREEVLFREGDRLDLGTWLRELVRFRSGRQVEQAPRPGSEATARPDA